MAESFFDRVYGNATHTPDVLSCLANLSNDEVFTPPEVVNQMLDMLPQELFKDPKTRFLDPRCKTGVFLREIAKRLLVGLEPIFPDLQERIDHIFHNQLYGIAITELTSLLSRRSLYCSKYPNGPYSVSHFENPQGNVRFKRTEHTWVDGRCKYCGASEKELKRDSNFETYAYEFIHTSSPEEILRMKFDVIISNVPYQLNVGNDGGNSSKARAIYHEFISQAEKLEPRYLCMIVPSRWMTKSTEGIPDSWVDHMINCNKIIKMVDFDDASVCFPGVEIKGGVNYFLMSKNYNGKCDYEFHDSEGNVQKRYDYLDSLNCGIVVRDVKATDIIRKIQKVEGENYLNNEETSFSGLVSPKDYFTNKQKLTSSWAAYKKEKDENHTVKYYLNKNIHKMDYAWISVNDIPKNLSAVPLNKVYIPAAGGSGNDQIVLGKPFVGDANSVCSQTYLVIGYDSKKHNLTKEQCENIVEYIKTKFFRYLVSIKKKTQNGPRMVYQFVPMQDFSRKWTDEDLYKKYELTSEEIGYIENSIRPMEA